MMGLWKYYWMLLLAVPIAGYSQAVRPVSSGIVRGEVKDKNSGLPLTGALVLVVNDTLRQQTGTEVVMKSKGFQRDTIRCTWMPKAIPES